MLPYSHEHYRHDLSVFCSRAIKDIEVPEHGPFWMLCGMTMGCLYDPQNRDSFMSPSDFLCYLYELNIINQGIYTYYPTLHFEWCQSSLPFINSRGCSYGHGGWTSRPNAILHFAENPSYISGAKPVDISRNQLVNYTNSFFFDYLPNTLSRRILNPEELLAHLKEDPDCGEVNDFV